MPYNVFLCESVIYAIMRARRKLPEILRYFQPASSLPTAADMGIGEAATREPNRAIEWVIAEGGGKKKRKRYTPFIDERRAKIGR